MHSGLEKFRTYLMAKVGHCARCMRQSLAAALAAWAVVAAAVLIRLDGLAVGLVGLAAVGLTALWLLHLAVNAARAVGRASAGDRRPVETEAAGAVALAGRRQALGLALRAAGIGVLASLPIAWSSRALAYCGQCTKDDDCGGSRNGWCCKNTAPVNAGYVCNECVQC